MPRPRFSLRWLMLAVFVVAVLLEAELMRRTRSFRLLKAVEYEQEERDWRRSLPQLEQQLASGRAIPRFANLSEDAFAKKLGDIRDVANNHRLWAEYSLQLARWYRQGAAKPWKPIGKEPEPPRELRGNPE